ncbi:hypothetical protein [Anatilimnocola floriformis]|uniref:hypothetical protein n=1 Tax=Anatilimnocola floriformis TaxID=2948575 RepID=UPI0020C38509|nr:hypothetical protein [Anatilimnocola floriformis]
MSTQPRRLQIENLEARTVLAAEISYFSTAAAGSVTGSDGVRVDFDDSDVIRLDIERNATGAITSYRYQMLFDGSDVGLDTDAEDIDALDILPDGSLVISTTGTAVVPGVTADKQDLLRFTPAANGYGTKTQGTWSLYFDGSDVGLTMDSENIDAVSVLPNGNLILSTSGFANVPNFSAFFWGEDILLFRPSPGGLGPQTAGSWGLYFDGSARLLDTYTEQIDAIDLQGDKLYMSTSGAFKVGTAAGDDEDVFEFNTTTNTYAPKLFLDGSVIGLAAHNLDGFEIIGDGEYAPAPSIVIPGPPVVDVAGVLSAAATKLAAYDARSVVKTAYPNDAGASATTWTTTNAANWVSGFYPGMLWEMYEATGDAVWATRAKAWQAGIEGQKNDTGNHDLGFMILDSFGQGARLTGNATYQAVVNAAARSLSARFNPKYGALDSWGSNRVIIDSMMNVELLFNAAKHGGTTSKGGTSQDLYNMAASHATQAMLNHVRPDGSTYHVVTYNTATGKPLSKSNAGGISTETTWARGQAWSVYGFTMTYRETGDVKFLETARKTADWFISHLPEDMVPQADFSSTYTDIAHKDSSAAAIAASGLLELSTLETDPIRQQKYFTAAGRILESLTSPDYFSAGSDHPGLLLHGARNYPGNNVSLVFGDYYLLEATIRYSKILATQPLTTPPAT